MSRHVRAQIDRLLDGFGGASTKVVSLEEIYHKGSHSDEVQLLWTFWRVGGRTALRVLRCGMLQGRPLGMMQPGEARLGIILH